MWLERNEMNNDPLMHAMRVTLRYNDAISRYLKDMTTNYRTNDIKDSLKKN